MRGIGSGALGVVLGVFGCGPGELCEGPECHCVPGRTLSDGTCCRGFTAPVDGVCAARSWTTPRVNDAVGEPGALGLEVVVDGDGSGVATWIDAGNGQLGQRVVIAEEGPDGWRLQDPGPALSGFATRASVAAGADAEVLVSWMQKLPGEPTPNGITYVSRRDQAGGWNHPAPDQALSLPPSGHEPRPLIAPSGEAFVVWNQWTSTGYGVAMSRRPPQEPAFVGPADAEDVLSPKVNNSNSPQIAVGSNGDALIAWYQALTVDPGHLMVFISERFRVDGEFTRPEPDTFISPPGSNADSHPVRNPVPAVGERGHAAVVWAQENARGDIPLYLATRDGLGHWTLPQTLHDTFSPAQGRATCAQVQFGRGAELFVIWYQDLGEGEQVWTAHRTAAGEWDVPGQAPEAISSVGSRAVDPWLAIGPDGEAVAVWSEAGPASWRIATRRRNPAAEHWSSLEHLSPDDGHDALNPIIAIAPTGRVLAAWRQGAFGREQVHFAVMD